MGAAGEAGYPAFIRALLLASLVFSSLACHPASATRDRAPQAAASAETPAVALVSASPEPPPPSPAVATSSSPAAIAASASAADAASVSVGKPGQCFVEITALLAAEIFRGVRRSPSRDASRARLSAETRGRWDGRDHALTYLQCRYAVRLNGKPFTYEHVAGQGFGSHRDLDTKTCDAPVEKDKVAKQIVETTKRCTEPHAGAYWGFDLVEVTP